MAKACSCGCSWSAAVCLGFFIHLLLDEIYSVEWDGKPHVKKSFGTAMKFVGNGWWPNFACYAKLAVLTYLVMNDPSVIHQIYTGQGQEVAKNLGQTVKDQFDSAVAKTRSKSSGDAAPVAADSCRSGQPDRLRTRTVPANSTPCRRRPSPGRPLRRQRHSNPALVAPQSVPARPRPIGRCPPTRHANAAVPANVEPPLQWPHCGAEHRPWPSRATATPARVLAIGRNIATTLRIGPPS